MAEFFLWPYQADDVPLTDKEYPMDENTETRAQGLVHTSVDDAKMSLQCMSHYYNPEILRRALELTESIPNQTTRQKMLRAALKRMEKEAQQ